MTYISLLICLTSLFVGWLLFRRAGTARQRAGLPPGEIVYADTRQWQECRRPLFSNRYRLTGRPDYLVRQGRSTIPVEVKSTTGVQQPYESHVLQVMAYCLLVEETEHRTPPFGLLHYPDATFQIPYTPQMRSDLAALVAALRNRLHEDNVHRSHDEPLRCVQCGFRDICSESL